MNADCKLSNMSGYKFQIRISLVMSYYVASGFLCLIFFVNLFRMILFVIHFISETNLDMCVLTVLYISYIELGAEQKSFLLFAVELMWS